MQFCEESGTGSYASLYDGTPTSSQPEQVELVRVPDEQHTRAQLLEAVTVDERGIATIHHRRAQSYITLAAVRVADGNTAAHVPFEQPEADTLPLGLPGDRPSKIGFFVGYSGPLLTRAVLRAGYYPGTTLMKSVGGGEEPNEIWAEIAGMKDFELDEKEWADQAGIFTELGFNQNSTRGLFSRVRHIRGEPTVRQRRLVVVPDEMADLVTGTQNDSGSSLMQIMTYTTQELPQIFPTETERPLGYGGDLQIGYSQEFEVEASITSDIRPKHLLGAFEVTVVPR